jgi:hypothetical protein
MSKLIKRNLTDIRKLRRMRPNDRKKFIKNCSKDFLDAISECAKNLLRGNVPLTAKQYRKLRTHRNALRLLSSRKSSTDARRRLLQQKGGFIGPLLGPLIGLASTLFGSLLNRGSGSTRND